MRISLFIILFISFKSFSQSKTSKIVVDIETRKPIPYVAIEIIENGKGIYSDENGKFTIPLKNDESLKISHLGYKSISIKSEKIKDTLFLKKNVINLNEVIVWSGKIKEKEIGYIKKKKTLRWHIRPQTQLATLIKLKNKINRSYINEILIPINKIITGFKGKKLTQKTEDFQSIFRVYIYKNENEKPGKNLLSTPILINTNQNSNDVLKVNISNEFIEFPANGVFIGIEMIGDFNKQGGITNYNNNKSVLPSFMYTNKKNKKLISVSFIKRVFGGYGWEKIDKTSKDFSMISDYNMAVSLILSVYE